MLTIGMISFAAPWALAAAAALPLVWLLLRLTPPAVRQINFPAIRLLFDLAPTERTTSHTPPWLLMLRMVILALVIGGIADPVVNPRADAGENTQGPLLVVIDNGWAAANDWDKRAGALTMLLENAERRGREVAIVTTAPPAIEGQAPRLMPAGEALARVGEITPQPWATNRNAARAQIAALDLPRPAAAVWISDGVETPDASALAETLAALGSLQVIENETNEAVVQYAPERARETRTDNIASSVNLRLARVATRETPQRQVTVRALDNAGQVLGRAQVTFAPGSGTATAPMALPSELANRVARFDVEGTGSAAATVLADDLWQRRPVGIASASVEGITAPLLEDAYYIQEALAPFAEVRTGTLDELLGRPLAVMIMAGGGRILESEIGRMTAWVDGGGVLVRFAGPRLGGNVDTLLPVRLREGERTLGGAMSWGTPANLAPFPAASPFRGMIIPEDITVSTQVLAEPSADLTSKTWARLRDGTPLVTAQPRGQGWLILFHVTATPEWSKLPLSGLFVDMLRRLVDMSRGIAGTAEEIETGALAPIAVLDALGRQTVPGPAVTPVASTAFATLVPGPKSPPGLYGRAGSTRALNLSASVPTVAPLDLPAGTARTGFTGVAHGTALKSALLTLALILMLADLVISFALRRLLPSRGAPVAASAALCLVLVAGLSRPGHAADAPVDSMISATILETRMAYISTGIAEVDRLVQAGLDGLTNVLAARTAAELGPAMRIDLAAPTITDQALVAFPLLYWRITATTQVPPAKGISALNDYLKRGGMVVFDAPDHTGTVGGGAPGAVTARLEAILRQLDLSQIGPMDADHALTRSFYLLQGLPGRYADDAIFVERGATTNDGASSIIIGSNDWASAWARSPNGQAMFAVVPGGERQRELAYRAGVNMVMYALTGNYKTDQVHVPAIMERLTQ